jgi:hypothetical protein
VTINAKDVIDYAQSFLGRPYVFGASGPDEFDCSSLVQYVYRHFGISLPRVTYDQVKTGQPVSIGDQKPGDLIFSDWGDGANSHVAMYLGGGKLIEAPQPGENVMISDYAGNYISHTNNIRRVFDDQGNPLDVSGVNDTPGVGARPAATGGNNVVTAAVNGLGHLFDSFASDVIPLEGIRQSIAGINQAFSDAQEIEKALIKLTHPTTLVRIGMGITGVTFFLLGLVVLIGEAKNA